jgi:hypothetical protein
MLQEVWLYTHPILSGNYKLLSSFTLPGEDDNIMTAR